METIVSSTTRLLAIIWKLHVRVQILQWGQSPIKGTQSHFCACTRVWFLNRWLRIQRCGNWYRAFTNPFALSSINFGFALKLLRIKDQWYTVLVKCQFVCNRDISVLTSMPFDGTSSGGECYDAGRRRLSPGSFQKGLENRETTEKYWNQQHSRISAKKPIHEA